MTSTWRFKSSPQSSSQYLLHVGTRSYTSTSRLYDLHFGLRPLQILSFDTASKSRPAAQHQAPLILFSAVTLPHLAHLIRSIRGPITSHTRGFKMAWRSHGATNSEMVTNLAKNGLIDSKRVEEAMLKVDRAHFAPASPYQDSPQSIGHRATISAPHMHASAACSLLPYLNPGSRVLDIGSGSGYLTAVLAHLVAPGGTVIGVDHIQPLVALSTSNFQKSDVGRKWLEDGTVQFIKADGRKGYKEGAPYDAIHVGAAAAEHHEELVTQLKSPGRLFVPVEDGDGQYIFVVDKDEKGVVERKRLYGVRYVPLCDAPKE